VGSAESSRYLWLLRHAKAAADPPRGGSDHERPLAPRGRRDASALGHRLKKLGFPPDAMPSLVLCSTAARTTETAERVMSGLDAVLDTRERLYYGSPSDVLAELRTLDDRVRSAMVVGHNPATHTLALDLLAGDDPARGRLAAFPTCALAVYRLPFPRFGDVAEGTAELAGFFTPPY
jgi:phosphohistidine phosphatase